MSDYSRKEEVLNTASHGLGLILAILGLVALIFKARTTELGVAGIVYGSSLVLLFLASTCYHAVTHHSVKGLFKLLDHSAIYLLIAGTYTPYLVLMADNSWSLWVLGLIWLLAAAGVVFKILARQKFPKISLATYLLMGWIAAGLIYPIYLNVASGGLWLLVAGGLLFSLGTLFYVAKHRQYTHAVWHLFVVGGCCCHYFSIYHFVV